MKSSDELKKRLDNIPSPETVEALFQMSKVIYIIGIIGTFLCILMGIFLFKNNFEPVCCIFISGTVVIALFVLCRAASVLFEGFAVMVGSSWLSAQYIKEQTEYFLQNISDTNES